MASAILSYIEKDFKKNNIDNIFIVIHGNFKSVKYFSNLLFFQIRYINVIYFNFKSSKNQQQPPI